MSVISLSLVSQWRLGELSVIREGIPAELALHWVGGTFYLVVCALISDDRSEELTTDRKSVV